MKTSLYDTHKSLGAKMVNFHGWEMPIQYTGIIDEHINTRTYVSIFDVSHMGRFEVRGSNALDCLQLLVTNDVSKLGTHQALYSPMCYDDGGIVDDLIMYRIEREKFLVVVNASNREKDLEWFIQHCRSGVIEDVSNESLLLAIQGPLAKNVLKKAMVGRDLDALKPFDLVIADIFGTECIVSRTGYTGEDGFEILFDSSKTEIWAKLIHLGSEFRIKPAGLGARDTLRLEAGLMLYGNDIDECITPLEVPLQWTVKSQKSDFIGKSALASRQVNRRLVGFELLAKRVARHGNEVFLKNGHKGGFVTSGTYSPTLRKSIGYCFVPLHTAPGEIIDVNIGGKLYEAKVAKSTRFYKRQ